MFRQAEGHPPDERQHSAKGGKEGGRPPRIIFIHPPNQTDEGRPAKGRGGERYVGRRPYSLQPRGLVRLLFYKKCSPIFVCMLRGGRGSFFLQGKTVPTTRLRPTQPSPRLPEDLVPARPPCLSAIGKDNKSLYLSDLGHKKRLFFCCAEPDSGKCYIC